MERALFHVHHKNLNGDIPYSCSFDSVPSSVLGDLPFKLEGWVQMGVPQGPAVPGSLAPAAVRRGLLWGSLAAAAAALRLGAAVGRDGAAGGGAARAGTGAPSSRWVQRPPPVPRGRPGGGARAGRGRGSAFGHPGGATERNCGSGTGVCPAERLLWTVHQWCSSTPRAGFVFGD